MKSSQKRAEADERVIRVNNVTSSIIIEWFTIM